MFIPTGGLMWPISTNAHDDDAEPDRVEAEVHDDRADIAVCDDAFKSAGIVVMFIGRCRMMREGP